MPLCTAGFDTVGPPSAAILPRVSLRGRWTRTVTCQRMSWKCTVSFPPEMVGLGRDLSVPFRMMRNEGA